MHIKTKAHLDCVEVQLDHETPNITVPRFPPFKKPSHNKRPPAVSFLASPSKVEDSLSISTKISGVNQQASSNYIVNHFLTTIRKHINSPTRSEIEGQIIRSLITQSGKLAYMLHIEWATYFTEYLQHKHQVPPGPINNLPLLIEEPSSITQYKPNLQQDLHYVLLNRNAWLFVTALYGGGPEVSLSEYLKEQGKDNPFDSQPIKATLSRVSSMQSGLVETQSYTSLTLPFGKSQFEMPPVGFYNENNYCFMHAALQSLLTVEQINCWMLTEGRVMVQKNADKFQWLSAYMEVVMQVAAKKAGSFIKIQSLKTLIGSIFNPKLQHDSQEFLRHFIERLSNEIQGQEKYDQPITDIVFQGQMMSLVTCEQCQYKSSKFESFLDLSVSMGASLDQCLKQFFAQEFLSDNYQCENCSMVSKAVKKYVIGTPPMFLMVHLKRFCMYPNKVKLHGHVQFPTTLDVQEYIGAKYKLRSIIVHYGTPERGHYVNFSQRQNQWYYFDDHKIYAVNESDALQQQAYVLFYEKSEEYLLEMQ